MLSSLLVRPRLTFRPIVADVHWANVLTTFDFVFRLKIIVVDAHVRTGLGRLLLLRSLTAMMRRLCRSIGSVACCLRRRVSLWRLLVRFNDTFTTAAVRKDASIARSAHTLYTKAHLAVSKFRVFMAALRSSCGHYIFLLCFLSSLFFFLFFSSPNLSGRRLDVYHTSTYGVALVRI